MKNPAEARFKIVRVLIELERACRVVPCVKILSALIGDLEELDEDWVGNRIVRDYIN